MNSLAIASAGVFAVLGLIHFAYTLHDFGPNPRYFRPRDKALLAAMRATKPAIAPAGRDYWSALLGFNLSHAIGVLLFALLIVIAARYRIDWLKPILVLLGIAFATIAWRCWFKVPMVGCIVGTVLMIGAWLVPQ
jgi:hypothetical protein